jgi:hypothetical protein
MEDINLYVTWSLEVETTEPDAMANVRKRSDKRVPTVMIAHARMLLDWSMAMSQECC